MAFPADNVSYKDQPLSRFSRWEVQNQAYIVSEKSRCAAHIKHAGQMEAAEKRLQRRLVGGIAGAPERGEPAFAFS